MAQRVHQPRLGHRDSDRNDEDGRKREQRLPPPDHDGSANTATASAAKLDWENEMRSPSHTTTRNASAASPARRDSAPRTMSTAVAISATTRKRP